MEERRERLTIGVVGAQAHDRLEGPKAFGPEKKREVIRGTRCVREKLANRRIRFDSGDAERPDRVVETKPARFGAPLAPWPP
jgi:hypothetical protein